MDEDQTARKSWSQFMQEHGKELHELDEGAYDQQAREGWQRDQGDEQQERRGPSACGAAKSGGCMCTGQCYRPRMSDIQRIECSVGIIEHVPRLDQIDLSRSSRFR